MMEYILKGYISWYTECSYTTTTKMRALQCKNSKGDELAVQMNNLDIKYVTSIEIKEIFSYKNYL